MRQQAKEFGIEMDRDSDSNSDSDSDAGSEASFDVIVDDGALQAARQARIAELTQALAKARTTEALNAMVAQAVQTAWQAAQSSPLPTGEDISKALQPNYDNRINGFMGAKQVIRRLETAANAWEAAVEHHQAALSARDLLLPHAGPDVLDYQLLQLEAVAYRLRAQEKALGGLLLPLQFPYSRAVGKTRTQNEAAGRLREACALREREFLHVLPSNVADIDAALRQQLAGIGPSMKDLLNNVNPSGELKSTAARSAPPGSQASQPEAMDEDSLTQYVQSCVALEAAAQGLLSAWAQAPGGPIAEAAQIARAMLTPQARETRAALRREAALTKAIDSLLVGEQRLPGRASAGQDTTPQAPWLPMLKAFNDLNRALQRADNAERLLQDHTAQWSAAQCEASRKVIDDLQTRIATAREDSSQQGSAALHQTLDHLIQQGIGMLQRTRGEVGDGQAEARAALPGLATAARHALAELRQSKVHPRIAAPSLEQCRWVCTAVAQACDDMAQVPETLAETQQHAARLQVAEQRARQAAQGALAPAMHQLADLCGAARTDTLTAAAAMQAQTARQLEARAATEAQAAGKLQAQREGTLQAAMAPVLMALDQRPRPAADAQTLPTHPWPRHADVLDPLNRGLRAARDAQATLDGHIASWSDEQRQESSEAIGALQARIAAGGKAALEGAISDLHRAFETIWRAGAQMLSAEPADGPDPTVAPSLADQALDAAQGFHGALQIPLEGRPLLEHQVVAFFAKAFGPLSKAGEGLRMPLGTPAEALARAGVLETAAKQAREAAHTGLTAPLQQWARWCEDLRTDAIGAAVLLDMKAIDALCEASDEALSAAVWQLSDRLLATHELVFDLPFQVTAEGSLTVAAPVAPPILPTPEEDLDMAKNAAAIAQRATELRAGLPKTVPPGALPEMARDYQSSRNRLSEMAYAARVASGLLPLFHEASQAIAQASVAERPRVAKQFAKAALSYHQDATDALSDYLEASLRLQSRSERQSAAIDGANVRQSERLVTLMQRSLEGLGHLLECRKMAIDIHARKASRHRDVRDGLMTITNRYERATQKIDDSMEHMAQRLDVESQLPDYADIANAEKANVMGEFGMLIWRGKFESSIVQAQLASDWLARFLGPDQALRTASDLTGCTELIDLLHLSLSEQNTFALKQVRDDSNTHLVRQMLKVSLDCMQRLKAFEARIGVLRQALAATPVATASSSATPQKTRQRRRR
ncbi:hypothetical protein [Paracidovorax valerianellae]|uniref:hypothetical protein n=1 Tax=Paracidovorax valerianellae TaxID=187868 RepID=UPI0023038CFE|nr:hypothetical protein [Paracidovorax valerianellae]MDA8443504.1 hypothetical protein [Paracidovorax valerianellae]